MNVGEQSLENVNREAALRQCSDCKSEDLRCEHGETFCNKCGLVQDY